MIDEAVGGLQARQIHRSSARGNLTDKAVQATKPKDHPYKVADGGGLYLLITTSGAKHWRWKYRVLGKEKLMALGTYPEVGLAAARQLRDSARSHLREVGDPMEKRRHDRLAAMSAAENSFESVARRWWADWHNARSERHAAYVLRRLEQDVFPEVGAKQVGKITAPELVKMAKKIEGRGALDISKRALQTTSQVFRYAIGLGIAARNPATDIRPSDVLKTRKKRNYARLDERELPAFLRQIEAYQGTAVTRLALKLMALTFVRTTELIGARWAEIDFKAAEWRIPAGRMKMRKEHIVPLAPQAVQVLRVLEQITGGTPLLFPGDRDREKPMSNNTILGAIDRMGYKGRMTGHGFRGLASTILHEKGLDHQHIELQLAHTPRDEISAAYNHALYLTQRRALMRTWANYLDKARKKMIISFDQDDDARDYSDSVEREFTDDEKKEMEIAGLPIEYQENWLSTQLRAISLMISGGPTVTEIRALSVPPSDSAAALARYLGRLHGGRDPAKTAVVMNFARARHVRIGGDPELLPTVEEAFQYLDAIINTVREIRSDIVMPTGKQKYTDTDNPDAVQLIVTSLESIWADMKNTGRAKGEYPFSVSRNPRSAFRTIADIVFAAARNKEKSNAEPAIKEYVKRKKSGKQ